MRLSRNEVKIKFGKQVFSVNPEKKTISCTLYFKPLFPVDYDGEIMFTGPSKECVSASVICAENDEFNERVGKKIALAKAENKAYKLVEKSLKSAKIIVSGTPNHIVEVSTAMFYLMSDFKTKTNRCIQHNTEYIEGLFDGEEE